MDRIEKLEERLSFVEDRLSRLEKKFKKTLGPERVHQSITEAPFFEECKEVLEYHFEPSFDSEKARFFTTTQVKEFIEIESGFELGSNRLGKVMRYLYPKFRVSRIVNGTPRKGYLLEVKDVS